MFEDTKKALTGRKRGRQSTSATPTETKRTKKTVHPLESTPPASAKTAEWKPPSGSWEEQVESVDMCQDEDAGNFIVYLKWKNGKKTQHPKEVVYRRCPQKVCAIFRERTRVSVWTGWFRDNVDSRQAHVCTNMKIDASFLRAPHPSFSRRWRTRPYRKHDQLGWVSYVEQTQSSFWLPDERGLFRVSIAATTHIRCHQQHIFLSCINSVLRVRPRGIPQFRA